MANRIEYLNITPADNGLIISYEEYTPPQKKGTYDMPSCISRKEVFDFDDPSEQNEGFEEAMKRFKQLFAIWASQNKSKGNPVAMEKPTKAY